MNDRKLFGTNVLIENFIKQLDQVEVLDGGWTIRYIDKTSGKEWIKYIFDDRSFSHNLLQIKPRLSTDDLIDIALNSTYPDEVIAAVNRLYYEDKQDNNQYRARLIEKLKERIQNKLEPSEKERITNIIQAGNLLSDLNRREIKGKHYTEVYNDADYFKNIAFQASQILLQLKA